MVELVKQNQAVSIFLLILISLIVFLQSLGTHGLEFRDDEIFYYKSTQEMLANNDLLNPTYFGENRFQKPILYYWFVIIFYKLFGISWSSARLAAVIFAVMSVWLTWDFARRLFNERVAALSAGILMTVPLFFRHARNVVPDMALNFFIVAAVWAGWRFLNEPGRPKYSLLFFVYCAVGFMIKGFAAFIVPVLTVGLYAVSMKQIRVFKSARIPSGLFIASLIILPWFIYMGMRHGQDYFSYMAGNETKDRLLGAGNNRNLFLNWIKFLCQHSVFYIQVVFSYFAPWSLFIFPAFPLALWKIKLKDQDSPVLKLLIIWISVTVVFFSSMYFVINHYMLVITTPFAILVSYFLLEPIKGSKFLNGVKENGQKIVLIFLLTLAVSAFSFINFYLTGLSVWWLPIFIISYIIMIIFMAGRKSHYRAPIILVLVLLFIYARSDLLVKSGIASHAVLQKFASVVRDQREKDLVISVGSNDIHEKEFQVYFDEKVHKAGTSVPYQTYTNLARLFEEYPRVYCLMTEQDYHDFLKMKPFKNVEIIHEEYIFRRRMNLNAGFIEALLRFDQEKIYSYLMEKVVLIRRNQIA